LEGFLRLALVVLDEEPTALLEPGDAAVGFFVDAGVHARRRRVGAFTR
jgi:hypothetical protein